MAAITIQKLDIYVRFSNGLLALTVLYIMSLKNIFISYEKVQAREPFKNQTGIKVVKDHYKTGTNVQKLNESGSIQMCGFQMVFESHLYTRVSKCYHYI